MALPFSTRTLNEPKGLQRLVGGQLKENAILEINNLLAAARSVSEVQLSDIVAVVKKNKYDPRIEPPTEVENLYRRYLEHYLADRTYSEGELADLAYLQVILGLSDLTVRQITTEVWRLTAREAISNGRLEAGEHAFLDALQGRLKLPDEVVTRIYAEEASTYLNRYVQEAVSDQRLSPDEETEISAIGKSLGAANVSPRVRLSSRSPDTDS